MENIGTVLGPKIMGLDSRDQGKLTDCSLSGIETITRPTLERTPSPAYLYADNGFGPRGKLPAVWNVGRWT